MDQPLNQVSSNRCFGGRQSRYSHQSATLGCTMHLSVFLPPQAEDAPVPVLYWLSGLTCTDENFVQKAGAQRVAAELGLAIVCPDTSPRGFDLPGEHAGYDFGSGAGFYVNATQAPWSENYRMYDYVTREIPDLVESNLPLNGGRRGVFGHSMGGHGALICALKNPGAYLSVSAFSPIVAPIQCPWGQKAFGGYLGDDRDTWKAYDSCELIAGAEHKLPILIDQGMDDNFLVEQLQPERLEAACTAAGHPLEIRRREGYDHSYFFIASFIEQHLRHHAEVLKR